MSQNSTSGPQTSSTTTTTVAELRCTLCGFVSYSRDEIGAHCEEAHELFLCQACNLVFKRRQSLQSHARAKHGTTFASSRPKNFGMNNRGAGRVTKKITSVSPSTSNMNNSHTCLCPWNGTCCAASRRRRRCRPVCRAGRKVPAEARGRSASGA